MNRIVLVLAVVAALTGGCWSAEALAAGTPPTIACSRVIIPACGLVDGVRQSFRNACAARRAGATDIVAGNCKREQVFCPMIYQPVCAMENGRQQTYPNACVATNAGAKLVSKGPCG